jgi:hypothetical protein
MGVKTMQGTPAQIFSDRFVSVKRYAMEDLI